MTLELGDLHRNIRCAPASQSEGGLRARRHLPVIGFVAKPAAA
jgi:hypothetical protein